MNARRCAAAAAAMGMVAGALAMPPAAGADHEVRLWCQAYTYAAGDGAGTIEATGESYADAFATAERAAFDVYRVPPWDITCTAVPPELARR